LSATSSPIANKVRIPTVADQPRNDILVPYRSNHMRSAAQATAAGAVIERNPAIKPIPNAKAYTVVEFTVGV
jgi:hypothetical protein